MVVWYPLNCVQPEHSREFVTDYSLYVPLSSPSSLPLYLPFHLRVAALSLRICTHQKSYAHVQQ